MYCGVPWMRFLSWPRTQAVPKSISFTWPVLVSMMLPGFRSPWIDPAAVHVRQRRGDLAEDQHELPQLGRLDLVERLAVDVLHQQLDALDLEPRLLEPAIVDLGDRRMVELLGRLEFGQRLLDVNLVLGLLLADHLEGILLAAGRLVADQKDRAARAGAERVDHAILHAGELGRTRHVCHAVPR